MVRTIVLDDSDELRVVVRANEPNAFDPPAIYGSVLRMYRVIGIKSSESVLELIPITSPILVTMVDTNRIEIK